MNIYLVEVRVNWDTIKNHPGQVKERWLVTAATERRAVKKVSVRTEVEAPVLLTIEKLDISSQPIKLN